MEEEDVRIKQTTVRRNLSSPFPDIGRVANVPKISFPNNIGRLASSPRGTASDEYRIQCNVASMSYSSAISLITSDQ